MAYTCERCGTQLTGKQQKYCSQKCSKLFLKSQWRKRNRERINAYNRAYRASGTSLKSGVIRYRESHCYRCSSKYNLQVAHIKPRWAGGDYNHVLTLCRKCHYWFDYYLREYWKPYAIYEAK